MPNWLLPENIADVLPSEARKIEDLRRRMLDNFRLYGYELVMPPLLEYVDSLLTGAGARHRPAHLQAGRPALRPHAGPARRHDARRSRASTPTCSTAMRSPACATPAACCTPGRRACTPPASRCRSAPKSTATPAWKRTPRSRNWRWPRWPWPASPTCAWTSHVGVLRAIWPTSRRPERRAGAVRTAARQGCAGPERLTAHYAPATRDACWRCRNLYGDVEVLARAREVLPRCRASPRRWPNWPRWRPRRWAAPKWRSTWPTCAAISTTAAPCSALYVPGLPNAVARGGRYDHVGEAFGRARPATGFSLDLRELARCCRAPSASTRSARRGAMPRAARTHRRPARRRAKS